jgi:ABC-type nitrate/sulfonate/bicarbonate transport system permease component
LAIDSRSLRRLLTALAGLGLGLLAWEVISATGWLDTSVPSIASVVEAFRDSESRSALLAATIVTGGEAVRGFAVGLVLALAAGAVAVVVPRLRRGLDQLATFENSVPLVAIGPVLLATVDRQTVPVAMSAVAVFFTIYVATTSGLSKVSAAHADVFQAFGARWWQRLVRVQIPSAVPVVVTSLKVTMPIAIVGAVIGEWFGTQGGLGPVMLVAMGSYQMPMLWAAAGCAVGLSILLYAAMALLEAQTDRRFRSG